MSLFRQLRSAWRNLTRKPRIERDLADEVSSYVELLTDKNMKDGMDERDARRAALVELGGVEQVKEEVREARGGYRIEILLRDLRYAARTLRKTPIFSLTVTLVLALGIGSTALMFTIVNSVLLKGPPFADGHQLYSLWQDLPQEKRVSFSTREFVMWQQQTKVFESIGAHTGTGFTITGRGEPELAIGQRVTPSLFTTLRVQPALGRTFVEAEGKAGHDRVVILSDRLWREKFGARPDVLGTALTMNAEPYTIVGVMPPTFDYPHLETWLWVPAALEGELFQQYIDAHFLRVIGRLKPGVTRERLQAEAALLGTRVNAPDDDTVRRFAAAPLQEVISGEMQRPLVVLLCAVAFLLLIACANVANLMLARANARQAEMAIRSALGASRGRLVAQLLTEAALLAFLGGALGLALAAWGLELVQHFAADTLPQLLHAQLDLQSFAFAMAAAAFAAVLFGLFPALTASRTDVQDALKGGPRASAGAGAERARHGLVFAEVALACVLLVGCGLMVRSFVALVQANPGFEARNLVTASAILSKERYGDADKMKRIYREILGRVQALPDVTAASAATHLPFRGNNWGNSFDVEGQPAPPGVQLNAQIRPVSPGYFATLQIPLQRGRDFDERDNETAPGVAIVNELMAQRFWPNESALGKRIRYGNEWLSIVGVCGNIQHRQLDGELDGEIYAPFPQVPADTLTFVGRGLTFVVRAANPLLVAISLRSSIRALDPEMVVEIDTMEALINRSIAQPRFRTWLIGIVSGFALVLACVGIYGVIAYLVAQRRKEIGIRIALGATRRDILQLVVGRTLKLTSAGVAAGVVAALFLARFLESILFGITTHDWIAFVGVPFCLIAIALVAGYLPARRATRVNPLTALRYE